MNTQALSPESRYYLEGNLFTGAPRIFKGIGTAQDSVYFAGIFGYFQSLVHALAPEARLLEPPFYEHDIALNYEVVV